MCELDQLNEMSRVNRRQFGSLGAVAGLGAAFAPWATACAQGARGLTESDVKFDAPGGTLAGLRDAKKVMARRLASDGYSVLVPNPFYRSAPAPQFKDFDDFRTQGGFQKVGPWMQQNTPAALTETAKAVVAWLDQQASVDTSKGIGNQGYCMSGSWTIRTAAAVPDRVKAGASFHGGQMVGDAPDSPDKLLAKTQASYLIAIAKNDDAQNPTHKDILKQAAEAAGRPAEIEVYGGDHGWTVPDSPVYNQAEADRAWERLLNLYKTAL